MVVIDMAGTTIKDNHDIELCFYKAAESTGLNATREYVLSMMAWSGTNVFEALWSERLLGRSEELIQDQILLSYYTFNKLPENHYSLHEVLDRDRPAIFQMILERIFRISSGCDFNCSINFLLFFRFMSFSSFRAIMIPSRWLTGSGRGRG